MSIRNEIAGLVDAAARRAQASGDLPSVALDDPAVERPANADHGDYASSLPLRLARAARMSPMQIADVISKQMQSPAYVGEMKVLPPGFINFRVADQWLAQQVDAIVAEGDKFAQSDLGKGQRAQVEFVSANPTGPLHVGNGRWASIGDSLARVLAAAGYEVEKEYLINDELTQVGIFARTVFARYQQLFGRDAPVPDDGYPGEYVIEVAQQIKDEVGDKYLNDAEPARELRDRAVELMIARIRDDLGAMNVNYDVWFNESNLYKPGGAYPDAMQLLRDKGAVMEKDGATWLKSSDLGEEKDNVLIRSTGVPTYFASDIAYHYDKFFRRGFNRVIDIWGADHQGHVSRVKTAVAALGVPEGGLEILIGQLVGLRRGNEVVRMSKRAGETVSLREVVDEVGADACRFFFLQRSADAQMEFDLDLANRKTNENPVYYVQYAHARIASILTQAAERGLDSTSGDVSLLTHPAELQLVRKMLLLPELVETIATNLEPHHLPHYAQELATSFHEFYEKCRVLPRVDTSAPLPEGAEDVDPERARARLRLVAAAKVVLARTLSLMGMSAPERM
jgi:arginyl-tRNA synthetase